MKQADLHTHTTYSDGCLAPADLVRKARAAGLQGLAVTDHDTIQALPEAMEAGRDAGVEIIPGVELSATVGRQEVHVLGYFFDPAHSGLHEKLTVFRQQRMDRARSIVERLRSAGVPLEFEDVLKQAAGGAVGRPHIALALVERGHVATFQDAFTDYLSDRSPTYVAKPFFPAQEAIDLLHEAGGIAVLAHPGNWTGDTAMMALIRAGLDGIETVHPSHDYVLTRYYRQIASDFAMLETGGSDYHGLREQDEFNLGRFVVTYPQLELIRSAA